MNNLFGEVPVPLGAEQIEVLVGAQQARLERIVSTGHATPAGQWYDQDTNEWVAVLQGSAGLRFADSEAVVVLRAGDHLVIPAHQRHRVEWTDGAGATIWLALHY